MTGVRVRQREQTRQALIQEARTLFAQRGYGAVGLAEIVAAAGVTKGALYHSFDGKIGLFREVLAQVQSEVAERVATSVSDDADSWVSFVEGCRAFLSVSNDPELSRIMLIDGPAVLGWAEWRRLDEQTSARHLAESLQQLVDDGVIAAQPVEPLTRLLSGAMNEAALWLAEARGTVDSEAVWAAFHGLLCSLR
ncbi:Transcriptional regulator, TetR family [Pseudonocardia sp. Ae406_Ps2]|uniref:TetR/AcrR family transcriptional regulator n=1 Tax=unclassified Pseudonocardia TaxID=2619320 RepID=UPI00094B68BE|nr:MULTISPECIES: TetR/AcrR family transcriptional regulator [unclassified Pseudonocardia]OLM01208.1 Transcriptional regulator, TetR family [Pseudonocardia sp. Ae406_Ps2]OLM06998.1 Transcriptional regulator, TetR family [Pseudonocardia sp. Ae331_Ps2]OLM14191.1 Transcriptional regulator, TetR family [Pseudonocardia sp. Ae505_Ps2]OLM31362.1 Transcriptional regulator, TetR family [Pseudonocardia sp. Ae717_Ps2]